MDRLACVNLPAYPLQLLLRRHPQWAAHPAAVVAEDTPLGRILWVNERARRAGALPGLTYAGGLSLAPELRAGVVLDAEIEKGLAALTKRLARFTPDVEPSSEDPGVFWLDATGLGLLYPSLEEWAGAVRSDLRGSGFSSTVVVGFTRFGSYAVAKSRQGVVVFRDPAHERDAARRVPLDRLDLDPEFRDTLEKLGVTSVEQLLSLPAGGLFERFGPEAHRLYRLASNDLWAPLQPQRDQEPVRQALALDDPESDATRLLFLVKRLLHPLLVALVARGEALAELSVCLLLDGRERREEGVRPAAPTLDAAQLLDLVRLRLEALKLPAGVVEIELTAQGIPANREQLRVFAQQPRRDLAAASRALARIRAEFGEGTVVRARLADGHLPEASFVWEPLAEVVPPKPSKPSLRPLVRRIFAKPVLLSTPRRSQEDGLLFREEHGPVERLHGPYVLSGGWWTMETHREYYFAETRRGDLLWVYYDRPQRRWFLHGQVE